MTQKTLIFQFFVMIKIKIVPNFIKHFIRKYSPYFWQIITF